MKLWLNNIAEDLDFTTHTVQCENLPQKAVFDFLVYSYKSQFKNCAWPCIINNSNVDFALIVRNVLIKDTITLVNEVRLST